MAKSPGSAIPHHVGLRRFAFLHDSNRLYSRERMEGYRRRLAGAGFPILVIDIPSSTFPPKIRAWQNLEMAWRQLSRLPQPCGLFAKDDISAQELCRRVGVSCESLRLRFQETLGRSPKQEVDRLRAEHVGEILRRQDWTLERIAEHCGFTGSDELCRFFKRVKGVTAGAWRKG